MGRLSAGRDDGIESSWPSRKPLQHARFLRDVARYPHWDEYQTAAATAPPGHDRREADGSSRDARRPLARLPTERTPGSAATGFPIPWRTPSKARACTSYASFAGSASMILTTSR